MKFDENGKEPKALNIVLWSAVIFVGTNLIFIVLLSIFGINANKAADNEKDDEYKQWKEKGIKPISVFISGLFGAIIFAPIAEELTFRFLLLKVVLVRGLKLPFMVANLIQAVLFGSIHLTNTISSTQSFKYSALQSLSGGISGFLDGIGYKESNSLLCPWLAHFFNNFIAVTAESASYASYYRKSNSSTSTSLPNMMARMKMKYMKRYMRVL